MKNDLHSNIFSPLSLYDNNKEGKPALKSKNLRAGMTYEIGLSHFWPRELSPLSITPEPLSCASPMYRQQSFHWLPHRAHSAAGDFHFAPGREPHSFLWRCSIPLAHALKFTLILVPFPALAICCPCLAQLHSLGSACLPAVPPLHPCAVITPWQGIADRNPCWSFNWSASCNVSFHTTQLVFTHTSEKHTSLRR